MSMQYAHPLALNYLALTACIISANITPDKALKEAGLNRIYDLEKSRNNSESVQKMKHDRRLEIAREIKKDLDNGVTMSAVSKKYKKDYVGIKRYLGYLAAKGE